MDTKQITDSLYKIYTVEDHRIVFWNDPDREFEEILDSLVLDDVEIIRTDSCGPFALKVRLEVDQPQQKFLLYSSSEEPEYDDDLLLDIRLCSRRFRADRSSMLLDELGLTKMQVAEHLKLRSKFFANKDRIVRLKSFLNPGDEALDIDKKIMAVLVKSDSVDFQMIARTLFGSYSEMDEIDFDSPPPTWSQIEKYELEEAFWNLASAEFGYNDNTPTPQKLLFRLFLSDFTYQLGDAVPAAIADQRLNSNGIANAVTCLAIWRDSTRQAESYNLIAEAIEHKFSITKAISSLEPEVLQDAITFPCVGRTILQGLWERLQATRDHVDATSFRAIATKRQSAHWILSSSVSDTSRLARKASFETLALAAEFFELCGRHSQEFVSESPQEMFALYTNELYRFDQLYRQFHFYAAQTKADLFKSLRNEIENAYRQTFLIPLSLKWAKFIDGGLLENWKIEGIDNQYDFFKTYVTPRLEKAENRKAYVIISDAFRYEVARELLDTLNGKYRIETEISAMLSVLPSYTALGMATLLPHDNLSYNDKGDVLVDGQSSAGIENRRVILAKYQGAAFSAKDFLDMKKEEKRQAAENQKVIYIYHNVIDSIGDSATTESEAFEAVARAIEELAEIVNRVVNDLSGSYILVTADHGFLFTETSPGETDRSKLQDKPTGAIVTKKRYIIGKSLPEHSDIWKGMTSTTAQCDGNMEFWIPKGFNRFHFVGGARFFHGGAMLQEIAVPLLTIRQLKDKAKAKTQISNVGISVLGMPIKITTSIYPIRFLQTDPASERIKPLTVKIAIYDEEEPVSSIETVTFDSTSSVLAQREKLVKMTLKNKTYDKKKIYKLVLRDAAMDYPVSDFDVYIALAIADDFGF